MILLIIFVHIRLIFKRLRILWVVLDLNWLILSRPSAADLLVRNRCECVSSRVGKLWVSGLMPHSQPRRRYIPIIRHFRLPSTTKSALPGLKSFFVNIEHISLILCLLLPFKIDYPQLGMPPAIPIHIPDRNLRKLLVRI